MQRLVSCDRETGERRYSPAFLYGDFQNFDLAYAVTTHSAQGRTVTTSTALVLGTEIPPVALHRHVAGRTGQ